MRTTNALQDGKVYGRHRQTQKDRQTDRQTQIQTQTQTASHAYIRTLEVEVEHGRVVSVEVAHAHRRIHSELCHETSMLSLGRACSSLHVVIGAPLFAELHDHGEFDSARCTAVVSILCAAGCFLFRCAEAHEEDNVRVPVFGTHMQKEGRGRKKAKKTGKNEEKQIQQRCSQKEYKYSRQMIVSNAHS